MKKKIFSSLAVMLLMSIGVMAQSGEGIRGDLNGDGKIGMSDIMLLVQRYLTGKFPDEEPEYQVVTVMDLLEENDYSIFVEALKRTGLSSHILKYKNDKVYTMDNPTDQSGNPLYYPKSRDDGWTVFAEKDDVFRAYGINNFEDLKTACAAWYGNPMWYDYVKEHGIEISTGDDYTNEWNVVHMFVAYHILHAALPVDKIVYEYNANSFQTWNFCFGYEPQSYYETLLPNTLMKIWETNPKTQKNLYINRYVQNNTLTDQYGTIGSDAMHPVLYIGAQIDRSETYSAENCYVHSIDKVLLYNQNAVNSQRERMRFCQNQLLPELANNGILRATPAEISKKNNGGTGNFVAFPLDYFENLYCYNNNMVLSYKTLSAGRAYESTQLQGWGEHYDFAIKLPPVPTGVYQLRMNYCPNARGGVMQFYIGEDNSLSSMNAVGLPLDACADPTIEGNGMGCEKILEEYAVDDDGYPYETGSDYGVESDKIMYNRGYMRAPASIFHSGNNIKTDKLVYDESDIYSAAKNIVGSTSCRSEWGYGTMMLRHIIGTNKIKQGKNYWLRIKNVTGHEIEWMLNFIELVPIDVVNNTTYMEDWY